MAAINLKEYTSRAKDLEAAIYTQKLLMQRHEGILKAQYPILPEMRSIPTPDKPDPKKYNITYDDSWWSNIIWLYVIGACGLMFCLLYGFTGEFLGFLVGGLFTLPGVGAILWTREELRKRNAIAQENEKLAQEYKEAEREYFLKLQEYNDQRIAAESEYECAKKRYPVEVQQYEIRQNAAIQKHNAALSELEKALQELYSNDVIFPKYRNLVAITAINEYLLSGRCYALEGPDGAYNLYEMELRQNVVIDHLASIVSDLEKIRSNQYSLYEQLIHANALVETITQELRDIHSDARLTAYFAEVTALAVSSPKVYISTTI